MILAMYCSLCIDLRIWKIPSYPKWLENDWTYLVAGTAFWLMQNIALQYSHLSNTQFWIDTASGMLFGSVVWDCVFGWMQYRDIFYPFRKWLFRMGFGSYKWQRILFDAIRVIAGVILIIL